jgi:hypothetical protein
MVTEAVLRGMAAEHVELGRQLWRQHQMQPGGLCAACGHVYPCDEVQRGAWLQMYWEQYLHERGRVPRPAGPHE